MAGEKIAKMLCGSQNAYGENMVFGVVVSTSPLKVKIDDKLTLDENHLYVGKLCRETKAYKDIHNHQYPKTNPSNVTKETEKFVTLWRGLNAGDKVVLFSFNNDQIFYIQEVVG